MVFSVRVFILVYIFNLQSLLSVSFLGTIYVIDEISEKGQNHVLDRSSRLKNHQ